MHVRMGQVGGGGKDFFEKTAVSTGILPLWAFSLRILLFLLLLCWLYQYLDFCGLKEAVANSIQYNSSGAFKSQKYIWEISSILCFIIKLR